ncbi:MAG: ATP-dependent helicase [Burkholderiales bacterium]|nr:ATP-dependent helicase [Burkholderiales bacterium]
MSALAAASVSRHQPTPAQQDAIVHGDAPLLVIAGAGTGKTATLAQRVAHLIGRGADPGRILLLTFTRRAAAELERRAGHMLARQLGQRGHATSIALPWAGTFHGAGARLLRNFATEVGLAANFTIHDRGDSEDLMALARQGLGIDVTRRRFPSPATCMAIYSRIVNADEPLAQVVRDGFPRCGEWEDALETLFGAYVDAKQAQHVLDFDDLLLYWAAMLADEAIAPRVRGLFDHVLVDEYQDTNRLQGTILRRLKPDGHGVTVVGDDAQAIYGFRAADVRNILDFPALFAPPATIVKLEANYRSLQPILDVANAVMAQGVDGFAKTLTAVRGPGERPHLVSVRDEADQARFVAEDVLAQRESGATLKQQAVLFRSASHSAVLELELVRRNIPFVKYGGLKFLEAAHVKDVLALLRFAHNLRDRLAGFRAVRLVAGIGPATAQRLLDAIGAAGAAPATLGAMPVPSAASHGWRGLAALCTALGAPASVWPNEFDEVVAWYEPQLGRLYDDADVRAGDLVQLRRIAATFPSRERFVTEITLDPPAATSDRPAAPSLDDDYLVLSTIHSAKGQEWRSVHVLNAVDGCLPSDMATGSATEIDEERRLLYVALTRARDRLTVIAPQKFHVTAQARYGDRHVYASRSRFLTPCVCAQFDEIAWPPAAEAAPPIASGARVDLARTIRAAWRR